MNAPYGGYAARAQAICDQWELLLAPSLLKSTSCLPSWMASLNSMTPSALRSRLQVMLLFWSSRQVSCRPSSILAWRQAHSAGHCLSGRACVCVMLSGTCAQSILVNRVPDCIVEVQSDYVQL
jgi:hypothetical protein